MLSALREDYIDRVARVASNYDKPSLLATLEKQKRRYTRVQDLTSWEFQLILRRKTLQEP
ncbi:MAG: hypothetical protein QW146_03990 [Candidatus Bathyarchaeia archaeon]